IDAHGRRMGSFVNAGWVERVQWLDDDRLAIAGFNNATNAGMFAVLDSRRLDGHSPATSDRTYVCDDCPAGSPILYATFPRSELNVTTAGQFNRASIDVMPDRVLVATDEMSPEMPWGATAIYEFDQSLRFIGAHYGGRYWDVHKRLEIEGRLRHPRDACPERGGPALIDLWDPEHGSSPIPVPKARGAER